MTDGGPSGFLAQNLLGSSSPYYHLGTIHHNRHRTLWQAALRRLRGGHDTLPRHVGPNQSQYFTGRALQARQVFACEDAGSYPYIWFHDVIALSACLDLLKPGQKVILQSHAPQLPSEEQAGVTVPGIEDTEWVRHAEQRAFGRADVLVFPNSGASEIYRPLLRTDSEIHYVESGCREMVARCTLPLDPENIYYLYIGRRLSIKGFDVALAGFAEAYAQDQSLRLLLLGQGEVVQDPGVIDVGHVSEPASWLAACDYMLSPNRQSYFDLAVLEALSLGTPLILTCTNGHEAFAESPSPGMTALTEADAQLLAQAILANRRKRSENQVASEANRQLFVERYSAQRYRSRLDAFIAGLVGRPRDLAAL